MYQKRFCPENRAFSLPRSVKHKLSKLFFRNLCRSYSAPLEAASNLLPHGQGLGSQTPLLALYCLPTPVPHGMTSAFFHPTAKLFMPPFASNRALKNIACTFASGSLWWLNSRFSRLLSMNHKLFCETCCAYFLCSGHEPTKRRSSLECTTDGCSACRHCVLCRVVWVRCTRRAASGPPCRHSPSVRAIYR